MSKTRQFEVLCVEDNRGDRKLIQTLFPCQKTNCHLVFSEDGEQALDYLFNRGPYGHAKSPDLILLDLNLPKISGSEVLAEVKAEPKLNHIPVIVFSSSVAHCDVARSYHLHANAYLKKPDNLEDFESDMEGIKKFWLETAELLPGNVSVAGSGC